MYEDRWPQFDELFEHAQSLGATEQAVFLTNECGEDHGLRKMLESLLGVSLEEQDRIQSTIDDAIVAMSSAMPDSTVTLDSGLAARTLSPMATLYGRYQVVEVIGEGGMGQAFKAYDPFFKKMVAIKIIKSGDEHKPETRQRFQQEMKLLAEVRGHPNIVRILNVSDPSENTPPYMVMEFVEGASLKKVMDSAQFGLFEALRYATGVATALEAIHSHGIIHRDIKPSNVIITDTGGVKLLDFGIGRFMDPNLNLFSTILGSPGTPGWMEPERNSGSLGDARSDIYVFGILLQKMLDVGIAQGDADQTVQNAALAIAEICTRRDPEHRYEHIRDVNRLLNDLLRQKGEPLNPSLGVTATQLSSVAGRWTGWLRRPTPKRDLPNRFHFELYVVEHGNQSVSGVVLYTGWRGLKAVSSGADVNTFGPGGDPSPEGSSIQWNATFKTHVHHGNSSGGEQPEVAEEYFWKATVEIRHGRPVMQVTITRRSEESRIFLKGDLALRYPQN